MAKPRLLILSQTLPFPPDGGVMMRTFHVLEQLSRSFEITALCFYRRNAVRYGLDVSERVAALLRFGHFEAFPIPQEWSRSRWVADHGRSAISGSPYTRYAYESKEFTHRLRQLLENESFDLVHFDSLDLASYLPITGDLPAVCVHHNAESDLLMRRAGVDQAYWRSRYLRFQADLMRREEERTCSSFALNVVVSEADRLVLQKICASATFAVVPNGVDLDYFVPGADGREGLVYIGGTSWFPNKDALQYFSEEILPRMRDKGLDPPVRWVGRASSEERQYFAKEHGIELTGYLDDIRPIVGDARVCIVPLRVGSGTRLKILTAWAMGKAVISTSVGCEGLDAVDGENILIRDDPEEFAEGIEQILKDAELRKRLAKTGRATVERLYGWDAIGRNMVELYRSVIGTRSVATVA